MSDSGISYFSGVIHCDYVNSTEEEFTAWQKELDVFLRENCKKFQYQLERGKQNGHLHYQLMLQTVQKYSQFPEDFVLEYRAYWQPMSTNHMRKLGLGEYSMKGDTRVAGPWAMPMPQKIISMIVADMERKNAPPLRDYQNAWKERILLDAQDRAILFAYEEKGGWGKGTLGDHLELFHGAIHIEVPERKQLWGYLVNKNLKPEDALERKIIIFNLVAAFPLHLLKPFTGFLEKLKGRKSVGEHYTAETFKFGFSPTIVVHSNFPTELFSRYLKDGRAISVNLREEYPDPDFSEDTSERSEGGEGVF